MAHSDDTEALIYRVALLRHVHGLSLEKIQKLVGKKVPHLYRLLAEAEDMKIVRRSVLAPRSARLEAEIISRLDRHANWATRTADVRVLPSPLGDEDTADALGFALAERLDSLAETSKMVAIGGSKPMLVAARNVERRWAGPSVVPTSLQQAFGHVEDANSQLVATILAERWNALSVHYRDRQRVPEKAAEQSGLYLAMLGPPPTGTLRELLEWHEAVAALPAMVQIRSAWDRTEVAVVGAASLDNDRLYHGTNDIIGGAKALRSRGGVAMFARRCIDRTGTAIPLVEGGDLESLEPAIPMSKIRALANGGGHVILVARGAGGYGCAAVMAAALANALICDEAGANEFKRAWDESYA